MAEFKGTEVRPTPDRVREALFSLLFSRLGSFTDMKVLELFAGSGAMSLEAISRHARSAVLIDVNRSAIRLIEENVRRCKCAEQTTIIQQDALQALPSLQHRAPFDLIFLDPPYGKNLIQKVLNKIDDLNLLSEDGIICAESEADFVVSEVGNLQHLESRRYGSSALHLFRRKMPEE